MAKKVIFACGECHRILEEGIDECNAHPDAHCTGDWQGYVVILDPSRSEIAKKINVESAGNYALKVNVR